MKAQKIYEEIKKAFPDYIDGRIEERRREEKREEAGCWSEGRKEGINK